jgi:hypothetical protein
MLQADPTNQTGCAPLFLPSNVVRQGIRAFFCSDECASDASDAGAASAFECADSSINLHTREHHRIFKIEDLTPIDVDPESLIWKSMENTAC